VRDGDWKYFNEDGTLAVAVKYKNGEMTKIAGVKLPKELEE
jgi:antitoxin component YwqK of YwqJK toxin-antitoxin module